MSKSNIIREKENHLILPFPVSNHRQQDSSMDKIQKFIHILQQPINYPYLKTSEN
jgi:hypothetical protein